MKLHELSPAHGSSKEGRRVGRGAGSGLGKTSGRGQKGQKSRSGGGVRPGFEGGQMPLQRRVPKRGFNNIFGTEYANINLDDLNLFEEGSVITQEVIVKSGLIKKPLDGIKILSDGELTKKLTVQVKGFSAKAKEKIEAVGGKAEVV